MNSVNLHSLGVAETRRHKAYKKNLQEAQKFMFPQCFCKTNSEISNEVIISIYVIQIKQNREDSKASLICFTPKFTIGKKNRK